MNESINTKLKELEEAGLYVFHGSPDGDIEVLEPRQGRHVPDFTKPTETILDGNPAISATPYVEFAIFRALVNGTNVPFSHNSGFGIRGGKKHFRVSSGEVLRAIEDKKGFVYVFDKNLFEPYNRDGDARENAMEWRSYALVQPVQVVEVDFSDIPGRDRIKVDD